MSSGLSNGYELKCLCDWQLSLLTLTNFSKKLRVKIVKENVHFEMIKQLIDLPKTLEYQQVRVALLMLNKVDYLILFQASCRPSRTSLICHVDSD